MLVTVAHWEQIRHLFSDEEKRLLNLANCGEVICPRGIVIDEAQLSKEMIDKLNAPISHGILS